jgi:hypothetical protein
VLSNVPAVRETQSWERETIPRSIQPFSLL